MYKLVLQSDFGLVDGAVSAMRGIAYSVNSELEISDLTHDIPQYSTWEASYRLFQTTAYWPQNTVFVSVVDPGVGSERKSVVAKCKNNQFIVTPNNGTLTHLYLTGFIEELREIDESRNRLKGSEKSFTFHGRDVYAYTGAKLAAKVISYEEVGPRLSLEEVVTLETVAVKINHESVQGSIDILDVRFGSLWTNISETVFEELEINFGEYLNVKIEHKDRIIYNNTVRFGRSFSEVNIGEAITYVNSLGYIALAINQGSFANAYNIETGISWLITFKKVKQ